MAGTIRFWFDFASPYARCAMVEVERIGTGLGREVDRLPVLPINSSARHACYLRDMPCRADLSGLDGGALLCQFEAKGGT